MTKLHYRIEELIPVTRAKAPPSMIKADLLHLMNCLDFNIADITYVNGIELVGKKMIDSEEIIYWPIEREGSGFTQLFKGSIKKVFIPDKDC